MWERRKPRHQPSGSDEVATSEVATSVAPKGNWLARLPSLPQHGVCYFCRMLGQQPRRDPGLLAEDQGDGARRVERVLGWSPTSKCSPRRRWRTAWRDLQRLKPDVLAPTIEMPGLTGLDSRSASAPATADQGGHRATFARSGFLRPRARRRRIRLYAEGLAGGRPRRGPAQGPSRRPRHRPATRTRRMVDADPLNDREARPCAWPAKACRPAKSRALICRRARCAITCPTRSANSGRQTASKPTASPPEGLALTTHS